MRLILSSVALTLLATAPLSAADLRATHQEIAVPPGKLHGKAFRPIKQQPCAAAAQANPSGSRVATTQPARSADCQAAVAKVAHAG